ncbi:MAG: hypothetical protein PWP23_986 [Candidatus Sumerlaeota bacterium]|nr:hypothetical protein [Candidatus Sumerlaeota bacterium]
MTQLLSPAWWLGGFADGFVWWAACAVAALAATPLCLRLFRFLPDRGGGLAPAFALYTASMMGWFLGLEGFGTPGAARARLALLAAAVVAGSAGWWTLWRVRSRYGLQPRRASVVRAYTPAVFLAVLALLSLPHGALTFWLSVLLLGAASAVAWIGNGEGLRRRLRTAALPTAAAHLLFLAGFVFFVNVRSYIPYATWDSSMSGAEKFGNLMHLTSSMRAVHLPPADAWFAGEASNYYYGGHTLVGSIAQGTGTEARFAFNFGIATIFALTLCTAFSLAFNFIQQTSALRRWRGIVLHRGVAFGLLGAAAVTLFGNLDAWEQLAERQPIGLNARIDALLEERPNLTTGQRTDLIVELRENPGLLRFTPRNLAAIDYWRSSRAVHGAPDTTTTPGTITEFPFFSAILGDLHAHHMVLPLFMVALAAVLQLLRKTQRGLRTAGQWFRRAGGDLALMALLIGMACPVNIWDCLVLGPLYLLALALSLRGLAFGDGWRWPFFVGASVLLLFLTALIVNAANGIVPVFGNPLITAGALLLLVAGLFMARWESTFTVWTIGVPAAMAFLTASFGGYETARAMEPGAAGSSLALHGFRDGLLFVLCVGVAAWSAFRATQPWKRWLASTGMAYAVCGFGALAVASPFLLFFHSPLQKEEAAFLSLVPPVLAPGLFGWVDGFWVEFWARSPINPFPHYLRTTLVDYFTHWGIFLFPVLPFLVGRTILKAADWTNGRFFAFVMVLLALAGFAFNIMRYWLGPLALVAAACCLVLAWGRSRERPLWTFLAIAFLYHWFCEALHFDDEYEGDYERYNTPFKIWYPLWPILAMAMVRVLALAWTTLRSPRLRVPVALRYAGVAGVVLLALLLTALGLLYPYAATATRTRHFFTDESAIPVWARAEDSPEHPIYARRTLDALEWMTHKPSTRDDAAAIAWLNANARPGDRLLEAPPDFNIQARAPLSASYSPVGRFAAATGIPTLVGWAHHELQWRGWKSSVPDSMARRYARHLTLEEQNLLETARIFFADGMSLADIQLIKNLAASPPSDRLRLAHLSFPERDDAWRQLLVHTINRRDIGSVGTFALTERLIAQADLLYESPSFDREVRDLLEFHGIDYVIVGSSERLRYAAHAEGLSKFTQWEPAFQQGNVTIYRVPAEFALEGDGS